MVESPNQSPSPKPHAECAGSPAVKGRSRIIAYLGSERGRFSVFELSL